MTAYTKYQVPEICGVFLGFFVLVAAIVVVKFELVVVETVVVVAGGLFTLNSG